MGHLRALNLHNRATVIARLTSGARNVAQLTEVGSARAPADHHMAVASGKDLLCQIDLEELTRALDDGVDVKERAIGVEHIAANRNSGAQAAPPSTAYLIPRRIATVCAG